MSLGQAGTALGFTLMIGLVNTFGSAVTAAFGVGNRIINMALVPSMGLSQACGTAVGQNLGACRPDRAARSVWVGAWMLTAILLPITRADLLLRRADLARVHQRSRRSCSTGAISFASPRSRSSPSGS